MGVGVSDQSRPPLQLQEEVQVGFEEVDDPESCDLGFPDVFLNHDVHRVAPSGEDEALLENDVEEFREAVEKDFVLD